MPSSSYLYLRYDNKLMPSQVAFLGLKRAIIAGDLPVVNLLIGAGVVFDEEFLTWAYRNSGQNKYVVMGWLLADNPHASLSIEVWYRLVSRLAEDKAGAEQERLAFIDCVQNSLRNYQGSRS
jgi:hypothetical protein